MYRLTGIGVGVEHGAETAIGVAPFSGDRGGAAHHGADERVVAGGQLVQGRDVALRDDQRVQRRLRIDVGDGEGAVVVVDVRRGGISFAPILQNRQSVITMSHGLRPHGRISACG